MKEKTKVDTVTSIILCFECRSSNLIIDEYNAEDWEGIDDAERAEREIGNHGTMTCLDCGAIREYDI